MDDNLARRVAAAARASGAEWALLTDVETVCYATGFQGVIEVGTSPFAGGPATVLVAADGSSCLLVTNLDEPAARDSRADEVVSYLGYCYERQQPLAQNYEAALAKVVQRHGVKGAVAVEWRSLPATAARTLIQRQASLVDISPALDKQRAVKTVEEIGHLRRSSTLSDIGQRLAMHCSRPGRTELDVFAEMRSGWENTVGTRLAVTGDFISGIDRTAAVGGWPTDRIVLEGDPVIADLAPRYAGYWSDSCNTFVVGDPSTELRTLHGLVSSALDAGISFLRPGVRACDVDATMRSIVQQAGYDYGHHSGHGIGTSVHEYPRLVPGETAVIEPSMVLLLEPGAYAEGIGGVRLEWMFLVTESGIERLSDFEHSLTLH